MIGTKFIQGQGLGNQLFCYVSTRCIAEDLGYNFGTAGIDNFANNIHSRRGMYFMDIDLGVEINKSLASIYHERDDRLYLWTSYHDIVNGCYVSSFDDGVYKISDNTLVLGNLQDERYFIHRKNEIKEWLAVKAEYELYDLSADDICVMNVRGGEYTSVSELFLQRKYWVDAMKNMQQINADMRFVIVSDDIKTSKLLFPELTVYHSDIASDYVRIKNAKYLIVSNSSFAFFPVFCSETIKYAIAPKYWARHNVSDGYWASEQNIYQCFRYQDRDGKLFTAEECNQELDLYKRVNQFEEKKNKRGKITGFCVEHRLILHATFALKRKISLWRP